MSGRSELLGIFPPVARSMPAAKRYPTRPVLFASLTDGCDRPAAAASLASEPNMAIACSISSVIGMTIKYRETYKSQ
jgi:hypothetical protein